MIQRWTTGEGGFIAEASLVCLAEEEARRYRRRDRYLCELTDVYTHPLRRGQGWARIVVEAALSHADAEEWDVFLRVVKHGEDGPRSRAPRLNTEGLKAFYGRCGFVMGGGPDNRVMLRRWRAN